MSRVGGSRGARNLFDKFPRGSPPPQTAPNSKTRVHIYRKRPNLVDPFEHFAENDVVRSWTSRISSLVRQNRNEEAVLLFKSMLVNGERPNFVTVLSAIKAICSLGSRKVARGLHGFSVKMGLVKSQVTVVTALVSAYSSSDMASAWKLYGEMMNKDVVLCSAMVSACVSQGDYLGAFKLLKEMSFLGPLPNHVTISSVLPACADLAALNLGREVHCYAIRKRFFIYTVCANSLLDMYSKCRCLETAIKVFEGMESKDIISWRIIVHGCVENENPGKALEFFTRLRASGEEKMDGYIIQEIIRAYLLLEEDYGSHGIHSLLLKMGLIAELPIMTELLQAYARYGDIDSSRKIFDNLEFKDVIAWSAMISVYAQSTQAYKVFDILQQMQLAGEKPNEFTFVSLLLACTSLEALYSSEGIHAMITKNGYISNSFLASALIDMYCKFGRTGQGKAIFDETNNKDLISWSSMINGYAVNGRGEEVLECFSKMLSSGIEPNDVIFISVLSSCSHCGMEYEGWSWFHAMQRTYGIRPKLAHFACMVDMLSRQGNIEEAFEFATNMPIEPDKRIWGAILAGCKNVDGASEILEFVTKRLIDLDPENMSHYVVLSNVYADQGRWEEVEKLRNLGDRKSLRKVVGYSTI